MLDLILSAVILIAAIYGFRLGLMKSLIGLLGNVLALLLSYFASRPVAELLQKQFQTGDWLAEHIKLIIPMPQDFSEMVASIDGMAKLYGYLEDSPLPKSIKESILSGVQAQVNEVGQGIFMTMADIIAQSVAQSMLQGLTFIGLWIAFCLVLALFGKIFAGFIHHIPVIGLIDRLGGMVVTLFLVGLTIAVLYSGISVLGLTDSGALAQSQILPALSGLIQR